MQAEQAIYTSARTNRTRGYQLIAKSESDASSLSFLNGQGIAVVC
jgi:hypothetical protein